MSEFEDKLQSILGNPEAMDQIMSIARSISGPSSTPDPTPAPGSNFEDPPRILDALDPRLMQIGMRLLSEYNREDERAVALLTALQPFVRQERYAKVDKAVQIAKLSRLIRIVLESVRKGDSGLV